MPVNGAEGRTRVKVAVIGATGFVGSAAARALESRGVTVVHVTAPRLPAMPASEAEPYIASSPAHLGHLTSTLRGVDAVVNAAGLPDASSTDSEALIAANAVLPGVVAAASVRAGVRRLVHVSSAAVQGRLPVLDDTDASDAFSDYARSKLLGERLARTFGEGSVVTYRPAGVHGPDRRVTRLVSRVASSRLASVASPGTSPSPQSLVENVADALAFLVTTSLIPPATVTHPWEGLTTADVMELLGGRNPRRVPRPVARAVVGAVRTVSRLVPGLAGQARRLEMLWFGQRQATSWLERAGWTPPLGRTAWAELGRTVRGQVS
ncbi:MAG TPA: NAD(P)-dependent oxidoreductase [Propionibacteriaceae bacterium]|nr:NAD(P)-dependent oxidoreductase [Propionibacteriaceae bacterium]